MRNHNLSTVLFCLALALYSIWYLAGVATVPFHPDESTYLFMSDALARTLRDPLGQVWQAHPADPQRQMYSLLNPPLIHHVLALGRAVASLPALPVDWDWSQTWQANAAAGALPSPGLLLAGRMAAAAWMPLTLLLLFLCARQIAGDFCAWLAAGLLASNALLLLHTRRAMAEGPLLFTMLLCLWLFSRQRRPQFWTAELAGAAAGLALCAKHSLLVLAPVGLLAVLWGAGKLLGMPRLRAALGYALGFAAVVLLLNPVLWHNPARVALEILHERTRLAEQQARGDSSSALDTPVERAAALLVHTFFAPPRTAELANYQAKTAAQEAKYFANPLHSLFRSIFAGSVLLILTMFGFVLACLHAAHARANPALRVWILAGAAQAVLLLLTVPLAWQRYYLPLVPYCCLWAAYGLDQIRRPLWQTLQRKEAADASLPPVLGPNG